MLSLPNDRPSIFSGNVSDHHNCITLGTEVVQQPLPPVLLQLVLNEQSCELGALCDLLQCSSQPQEVATADAPIFQWEKLRHREMKCLPRISLLACQRAWFQTQLCLTPATLCDTSTEMGEKA